MFDWRFCASKCAAISVAFASRCRSEIEFGRFEDRGRAGPRQSWRFRHSPSEVCRSWRTRRRDDGSGPTARDRDRRTHPGCCKTRIVKVPPLPSQRRLREVVPAVCSCGRLPHITGQSFGATTRRASYSVTTCRSGRRSAAVETAKWCIHEALPCQVCFPARYDLHPIGQRNRAC